VDRGYVHVSIKTRSLYTAEIARVGGRYAVQGHSRSLILVPIESPYIMANTNYRYSSCVDAR